MRSPASSFCLIALVYRVSSEEFWSEATATQCGPVLEDALQITEAFKEFPCDGLPTVRCV